MSAGACPVCREPKERRNHLVCPTCWVRVPEADQRRVYELYEKAKGSDEHRAACFAVVRQLLTARREALAKPLRRKPRTS